jgi:hypothetical protein
MGYTYVDVDSLEGEGPGGMVRKTRRATGTGAPVDGAYEPPWG